jgi:glycogen debranching enzyme
MREARRSCAVGLFATCLVFTSATTHAQPVEIVTPGVSDRLVLTTDAVAPVRFVAAHGRRATWLGYGREGLEMWAYPIQVLSHYSIAIHPEGSARAIPGELLLRRIEVRPGATTRIYVGSNFVIREELFVPLDQPGAIVTYTVEGRQPVDIVAHFTPVLDLMWPAAIGGQSAEWRDAILPKVPGYLLPEYLLSEPLHRFSAAIASPDIIAHDPIENSALPSFEGLAFTVRPSRTPAGTLQARIFCALDSGESVPGTEINQLATNAATLLRESAAHYADLLSKALRIETPDERVNQAIAWSEIALDQAWVCDPGVGCGIVAGYGPSRGARRPQYDWFFAGDGLIATDGLIAVGEYDRAREEIEFILKYQEAKSGMIWHELSQSAQYLDWAGKYSYMFVHVDVTFQFLATVARYVTASGDIDYVRQHWDRLALAYAYCRSQIDPATRLPRIPAGKEGPNEQERMSDDLGLSTAWLTAAESFAQLADATGHALEAGQARQAVAMARPALADRYWDAQRAFWISGHTDAGKPILDARSGPGELIGQHVFSAEENAILLDKLASADFQTDWGTRGASAASSSYDPDSYATGSVFALNSAGMASTFWQSHRPATALTIWHTLVPLNWLDALGHMHEVLAGDFYHQQSESVPEQTWSSAGFLDTTVHGLLGLNVQAGSSRIAFAPHIPADWGHLSIANVRTGSGMLTLDLGRSATLTNLQIANDGAPVALVFDPEIPLGATRVAASCNGRTIAASLERNAQDEHARLELTVPRGKTHCDLRYQGGVDVIPDIPRPQVGDTSIGLKIIGLSLERNVLTVTADAYLRKQTSFTLRTAAIPESLGGARLEGVPDGSYRVILDSRSNPVSGYVRRTIRLRLVQTGSEHRLLNKR